MIAGAPAVRPLTEVECGYPRIACDICLRFVEWPRSGKWAAPS